MGFHQDLQKYFHFSSGASQSVFSMNIFVPLWIHSSQSKKQFRSSVVPIANFWQPFGNLLATFLATFLAKNLFFAKVLQIIFYPFGHLYLSSGTILEHYLADFGHKYDCIKFWNFGPKFTARGRFPPKMPLKSTIFWGSLKLLCSWNKYCVCSPFMRIQHYLYVVF